MTTTRYAHIGGIERPPLAGVPQRPGLVNVLIDVKQALAALDPGHRVERVDLLDAPGSFVADRVLPALAERLTAGPSQHVWVVLAGEVVESFGALFLVTAGASPYQPGVPLAQVCAVLGGLRADRLAIVLDVHNGELGLELPAHVRRPPVAAIAALPWPPSATLLAIGPGVAERLPTVLQATDSPRTGAAVLRQLGAAGRATDDLLCVASAKVAQVAAGSEEALLRAYLRRLKRETLRLAFELRATDGTEAPGLAAAYVAAWVTTAEDERPDQEPKRRSRADAEPKERPKRTLHDLLPDSPRLFVVGGPGSGKTTFLHKLAHEAADALLDEGEPSAYLSDKPLPVLVRLEDYGRRCRERGEHPSTQGLLDFALGALSCGNGDTLPLETAKAALKDERLLLLLDGLDEVPESTPEMGRRHAVAAAIRGLPAECERLRMVATCRGAAVSAGADPGPELRRADLEPFDEEQQRRFVLAWMRQRHGAETMAEDETARLLEELYANDRLAGEAHNPLLLTTVCVLFHEAKRLPPERVLLYDRIVELLLDDRQRSKKGLERWRGPAADLPMTTRRSAAMALAWKHRTSAPLLGDDTALMAEGEAVQCLAVVVRDVAADLLKFVEQRAGLLDWRGTRPGSGERLLAFPHRTITEYLAACHLAALSSQDVPAELTDHALDADWREVFVLYAALIAADTKRSVDPAMTLVTDLARKAAVAINQGTPIEGATYGRLAAECLAECRPRATAEALDAVDQELQTLFADAEQSRAFPESERVAFWAAVGMNDGRLAPEKRWVIVPPGYAWLGAVPGDDEARDNEKPGRPVMLDESLRVQRWPVLVAEYETFERDGGYEDRAWWDEPGWAWMTSEQQNRRPEDWRRQLLRGGNRPVTGVSFWEARAWCAWATARWGDAIGLPEGWVVRLPTEAEWEKAARQPSPEGVAEPGHVDQRTYPWGADAPSEERAAFGDCPPWPPVGAYPYGTNPIGLIDMAGNVWEWCLDAYAPYAKAGSGPAVNPFVLSPGGKDWQGAGRVARGGGFWGEPGDLRVSYRGRGSPGDRGDILGFRCVASPRDPWSLALGPDPTRRA